MFVFPLLAYPLTGSALVAAASPRRLHLLGLAAALLPAGVLADRVRPRAADAAAERRRLRCCTRSLVVAGVTGALDACRTCSGSPLLTGRLRRRCSAPRETSAVRVRGRDRGPADGAVASTRRASTSPPLVGAPTGRAAVQPSTRWLPFAVDAVSVRRSPGSCWAGSGPTCPAPHAAGDAPRARLRQQPAWRVSRFIIAQRRCSCGLHLVCAASTNLAGQRDLFFTAVLRLIQGGFPHRSRSASSRRRLGLFGAPRRDSPRPGIIEQVPPPGSLALATAWSLASRSPCR